jgi:hypothetical protein
VGCSTAESPKTPPDAQPVVDPQPKIRQFTAKKNASWAYKDDDQVFELERPIGCTIRWDVIAYHSRPGQLSVEVKDGCRFETGMEKSLPYYGQLLDAVLARYSKDQLKTFSSSSWREIRAWDQDLAVSAMESGLWKSFLKKRQNKDDLKSNAVFVQVFNEGNVARKLNEVFEARGLALRLKTVEDVEEARFKNLPFAHEYAAYSASNTKVPYTAHAFHFDIRAAGDAN